MSDFRRFCIGVAFALAAMLLIARLIGANGVLPLDLIIRCALLAAVAGIVSVAFFGKGAA